MIGLVVVDDHPVVCDGIAAVLDDEPDFHVTGRAHSGREAVDVVSRTHPAVVVMDHRLTDATGAAVCEKLLQRHPRIKVVIVTSFSTETTMLTAFTAGAKGFLVKGSPPWVFRQAVRAVAGGGVFVDPDIADRLVHLAAYGGRHGGFHGLTMRQVRVVQCLTRGMTNGEIGQQLGISPETVKTHVRNAMRTLGASDRANTAAIAIRRGLA